MNRQILFNRFIRSPIHKAIIWYLKRCGGAFHSYPYGENGKYVRLFTDAEYTKYQTFLASQYSTREDS